MDPIRVAIQDQWAVLQVGEEPGRDVAVVIDEVPFGQSILRPEDLVEIAESNFGSGGLGSPPFGTILHRSLPFEVLL